MSNMLRIWRTDGGVTINGTNYEFDHFDQVTFTVSQMKHITRGANSKNKTGIDIEENNKQPDTAAVTILDISADLVKLLNKCYEDDTRITLWFIDRANLGKVQYNNAKIQQRVQQLNIGESEDNLNVTLTVESFDVDTGD